MTPNALAHSRDHRPLDLVRPAAPLRGLVPDDADRTPDLRPEPADPQAHRPVWFALRYELGSAPGSALRSSVWRQLRRLRALRLEPCTWAVAQQDDTLERLATLAAQIRAGGGDASLAAAGYATRPDVGLQSRLSRACEHLWDDLLNAADWVESQSLLAVTVGSVRSQPARTRVEHAGAIDALRATFASTLALDVVASDASAAAADRIDDLAAWSDAEDEGEPFVLDRRLRHRVQLDAAWRRRDGATRHVAHLHPLPTRRWERAFQAFESRIYRPSATRVPVRHGTLEWSADPGSFDEAVAAIGGRISLFEQAST